MAAPEALRPALLLLSSLLLAAGPHLAAAQKYNLTKAVQSTLVQSHDPPSSVCSVPGVCVPINQTIDARTLWYWCGNYATHRTRYTVTSTTATANLTTMYMIRLSELQNCALPNVTWAGDICEPIPESSCSSRRTCSVRTFGLVFPAETCLVIINNRASPIVATIQLQNYYDSPRYYGTVFVIFFTVCGGLAIIANVSWQFYSIIVAPVGKHTESVKPKRASADGGGGGGNRPVAAAAAAAERNAAAAGVAIEMGATPSSPAASGAAGAGAAGGGTGGSRWYNKLMAQLRLHLSGGDKHRA